VADTSGAPRLALHAVELGFVHPVSGEAMHWTMPLPADLQGFLERLRNRPPEPSRKQTATANDTNKKGRTSGKQRANRRANDGNQVDGH
jgi:hypothetical protein